MEFSNDVVDKLDGSSSNCNSHAPLCKLCGMNWRNHNYGYSTPWPISTIEAFTAAPKVSSKRYCFDDSFQDESDDDSSTPSFLFIMVMMVMNSIR
jgi:hypothetical protein